MVLHVARLQQARPGQALHPWELPQAVNQARPGQQQQPPTVKLLTPVARPPPSHGEWAGMEARVVLANEPGHWIAFVNVAGPGGAGVWYRTDGRVVRQADPWVGQCDPTMGRRGYTIDVIWFSQ